MNYSDWFESHGQKHKNIMKKLEGFSDADVIRSDHCNIGCSVLDGCGYFVRGCDGNVFELKVFLCIGVCCKQ